MIFLKKHPDGYILIKTDDCSVAFTGNDVEIEVEGYDEPTKRDIKPLIPYLWTQYEPFNAELPKFNGTQAPTGCTQISLAMVTAYYANIGINGKKYPKGMDATAEYVSKKGTAYELTNPALPAVPVPPADGCFDFAAFNINKPDDFKTDASKAAVAKFLKHIAYSDHTSFGPSASSCSLSRALSETINKRMHLAKKAVLILAKDMGMDAFEEAVYQELQGGHPVIMATSGTRTENGKKTVLDHTFLCDGFRVSDGKFHFNMNGNTAQNGWYDMANAVKKWNGITWDWTHTTSGELGMQCIIDLHPDEI